MQGKYARIFLRKKSVSKVLDEKSRLEVSKLPKCQIYFLQVHVLEYEEIYVGVCNLPKLCNFCHFKTTRQNVSGFPIELENQIS